MKRRFFHFCPKGTLAFTETISSISEGHSRKNSPSQSLVDWDWHFSQTRITIRIK